MQYLKTIVALLLLTFSLQNSFSQKKQLDHSVYDDWKSLSNVSVDNNGRYAVTIIRPQEGDSKLFVQDLKKSKTFEHNRVSNYSLSPDGKYTVALLKAPFADTRQAKIDKKKPEEMPKDSLLIIDNETFTYHVLPNVKSYKTSTELGNYVAYKTTMQKDTTSLPKDTTNLAPNDTVANDTKKKDKDKDKELLILHNLKTQQQDTLRNATDFVFNKYGNAFATIIAPDKKDSTDTPGVVFIDLNNYSKKRISNEKAEYKSLRFDEAGEQLVYLATTDTSKVEQKVFDVRYFKNGADSAVVLAKTSTVTLPDNWIFNENSSPYFSKNGERIILGSAPKQEAKDTTIVDFEVASLDIWNWKDPYIQPQQLNRLSNELKRTYIGVIQLDKGNKFTLLANEEMPYSAISAEGNGRYALLYSDIPYRLQSQWTSTQYDVWVYDLETDALTSVATSLNGRPMLSEQGDYIYWFDTEEGDWYIYDNQTAVTANVTEGIDVNFWYEKHDVPSKPGSYGIASWGENDNYLLVNDAFDIWKIDPQNKVKAENITLHIGRKDSITFRYLNTDREKRFVEANETLLLEAFDNKSKENGLYLYSPKQKRNPVKQLILDKFQFTNITKAKEKDVYLFQKSNFNTSPDLYVTTDLWKSNKKLTDINPQMKDYLWGTPELFSWTSFAGVPLKGIVYKPENFDETKKYRN